MFKILGLILLIFLLIIVFVPSARIYMNTWFQRDKTESKEEQILGTVSRYNSQVEKIQKILKTAGFDPGPVDGIIGSRTRGAIKSFQAANGLKANGRIDMLTWLALNKEKETIKSIPPTVLENNLFLYQSSDIDVEAKDSKIEAEDTKSSTEIHDEITNYNFKSKNRAIQIQTALKKAGFYKGKIDGKTGPQTTRAIKEFQKSKRLMVDGIVGIKTWEELSKYLND